MVIEVRIATSVADTDPNKKVPPDPHGQMRIRIREVKKPRKYTSLLGEYKTGRSKVTILLFNLKLYVVYYFLMIFNVILKDLAEIFVCVIFLI